MTRRMTPIAAWIVTACLASGYLLTQAMSDQVREQFKLGTFQHRGQTFIGLVLRDTIVIDIAMANASLERDDPSLGKLAMPHDMKELISRYEHDGLKQRLYAIVNKVSAIVSGASRPMYVHDLRAVKVLPSIMYPETLLNAAVNYEEHARESAQIQPATAGGQPSLVQREEPGAVPGLWERKAGDTRHNPYLFLKPRSAVIADGEAIRIPPGRDRIDWECELVVVIGRQASRVPIERANDYIFGYTLENDVSDRGGRGDRRHGSDWLVSKGHDTFAPLGPFIVPKEFIKDPHQLRIKFTLSGKVMQDSNTTRMTHNVYELLYYASNILTLQPGDVIATGSPAGVGSARTPPIFMRPGDVAVCTIEGIGTLTNPVVGSSPPAKSSQEAAARPGQRRGRQTEPGPAPDPGR